ncbi:MAG: ABC transporter permease subunit [Lachnospira sp.]|nr:ABC transporter permease subunit [Lachnospira sp.]
MKTRTNKFSRSLAFILLTVLCLSALMLTSCGNKKVIENKVFSVDDLEGKSIGVQLGTTGDIYCSDYEGDEAGTIVERYNKGADAVQALKQGKIDAVVIDEQPAKAYVNANQELMILDEEFALEEYAICISKSNSTLKNSINEAIEALKSEGKIQTIIDNYIGENAPKTPYTPTSDGKNGVLKMATNAYFEPYEYYNNGSVTGIDVDIANSIADYLGMKLQIEDMEFDSIITAVASGKVDMGAAGMTVTEERLKNIDFTTSYTTAKQVVIVRNNDANLTGQNFIEKFKQDFVQDGRYQYLLKGFLNTLMIAACAAIMGIVIGFLVAVVRSSHDKTGNMKILNFICNIYLTVIRGTPTMVQLLIIYYIIFGSLSVSKVLVAILAFGINSGAYVAEIFRSGIMSIDNGQFEAARSLGLTYRQTMISVILPQAFKNVLPALANEFIVLLKETSISGYIGLNDLTRGGDIIRSITYDPFLPLIGVAIIYLVLVMILSSLVKKLERRLRSNER